MPFVGAPPNIERTGVVCGFLITPSQAGLAAYIYPGVLFAQGTMWRPGAVQNPPPVPASQQSWLWYNSSAGLYWTSAPTALNEGDAFVGWVKANAERIVAVSRQEIWIPEAERNITVVPLGQSLPQGPGGGNTHGDTDVPGQPMFSAATDFRGGLLVQIQGFQAPENSGSIATMTFVVVYREEREAAKSGLTADVDAEATVLSVGNGAAFQVEYSYVLGRELVWVQSIEGDNLTVVRGAFGTTPAAHKAAKSVTQATNATPVVVSCAGHGRENEDLVTLSGVGGNTAANSGWQVMGKTTDTFELLGSSGNAAYTSGGTVAAEEFYEAHFHVMSFPFEPEFFSGEEWENWQGRIELPCAQPWAIEGWATNVFGRSESLIKVANVWSNRTLLGGRIDLEVEGTLGIESDAVAEIAAPYAFAAQWVWAYVEGAPQGAGIRAMVTRNGADWCEVVIADGAYGAVALRNGLALERLEAGDKIGLDITAVGTTFPGSRLVVQVMM